ncbi:hypothetical protein M0R45_018818 [Rubus argutus]|uniref:Protein TSSC4 n=1 Tax=Rubus argutus TaxID=59490 RepID=A0AAW1X663_RUBAR
MTVREESSGEVQNLVSDNGSGLTASRVSLKNKTVAQVPDYLVDPSKYTCYSFDSTSEGDQEKTGDGKSVDGSTRTKQDVEDDNKQSLNKKGFRIVIAALEESEMNAMEEEDKLELNATLFK